MPTIRKLEPEEVRGLENKGKSARKLVEELYDQMLSEFVVGEFGELLPDVGEKRLTARSRLKAAAKRRGVDLTFLRSRSAGDAIRFKVEEQNGKPKAPARAKPVRRERDEQEPTPVVPSLNTPPPAKRKGGRPRKKNPA